MAVAGVTNTARACNGKGTWSALFGECGQESTGYRSGVSEQVNAEFLLGLRGQSCVSRANVLENTQALSVWTQSFCRLHRAALECCHTAPQLTFADGMILESKRLCLY